ncbi:MAG TPA: cytochrome c biogenesis protein CcsA [Chitinivibrionales bacterium]|nr:cytochrome c biogenesis protein CcsA [Chitinivibrionales bacterium]
MNPTRGSSFIAATAGVVVLAATLAFGEKAAASALPMDEFAKTIILDNGRLKPLDTYARKMLVQFSGRQTCHGLSAVQWLASVVFTPLDAANDKVFLINNPEVADGIGIAPEKRRRYSFNEIKIGYHQLAGLARDAGLKEARERSQFESEVLRVSASVQDYMQLSSVLMFLMPSPEFPVADTVARRYLGIGPQTSMLSYYELVQKSQLVSSAMKAAMEKDKRAWTLFDMTMVSLGRSLFRWGESRGDQPFHIVPVSLDGREEWQCPWLVALKAGASVSRSPALTLLAAMRASYVSGDRAGFSRAAVSFNEAARKNATRLPGSSVELFYNAMNPFAKSKIIYGIAAIMALLLMTVISRRWLYVLAVALTAVALLPHTFGLAARIIILHRPPLATIYETFLFVAWACVALGLVLEAFQKKSLGLLISSLCGFFFLHLAGKYNAGEDSMGMIAAVLNSNFWLTTHITAVTLGYAGCCCAGIVGHVYLVKKLFLNTPDEKLSSTAGSMYGILAFGLVFTVIGTMLGGMWADQSWGRFWGWDPKENGALLIILWSAAVFHARTAGIIRDRGFAAGAVASLILVMFAWIGVNLLGIGMHSYGFTSTGVSILYAFMIFEAVFLCAAAAAWFVSARKRIKT